MEDLKGLVAAILILLVTPNWLQAQVLTDQQLDNVSRSIVKIYARHTEEKAASGFIYGSSDQVVTALHVVAGASRIQVKIADGSLQTAQIIRVLKKQDLVLLKLRNASGRSPLISQNINLNSGDEVLCVGYPFNIPVSDQTFLRVRSDNRRLRDIIPPKVKDQLDDIGFPSTNTIILNLDGHLLPGLSGAPIFNRNARIVAISNGGLAVGGASRSWAIPASHLVSLTSSLDPIPNQSVLSRDLFAEVLSPEIELTVIRDNSTEDELLFIRKASYYEMLNTTDDPLGLTQITQTFGAINLMGMTYDIYRDRSTGATLVVPGNASEPSFENNFWMVESADNLAQLYFRIDRSPNQFQIQARSTAFENDLARNDNIEYWALNAQWSYPFVRPTLSGMSVRRKAFQKWWNGYPIKQMIVTFSFKENLLLSSAAKLNDQSTLFQSPNANLLWFQYCTSAFLTTLAN